MLSTNKSNSGEDGTPFDELKDAVSCLSITFKQEMIAHLIKSLEGKDETDGSEVRRIQTVFKSSNVYDS